jgi:hypothetical protein
LRVVARTGRGTGDRLMMLTCQMIMRRGLAPGLACDTAAGAGVGDEAGMQAVWSGTCDKADSRLGRSSASSGSGYDRDDVVVCAAVRRTLVHPCVFLSLEPPL